MAADPLAPDVERQAGSSASGPCSAVAEPGHGAIDAGRAQVDLAHLGRVAVAHLGACVVGRQPGRATGPRSRRRRAARSAGSEAEDHGGLAPAACRPGRPAGTARSASGLHDDLVALEVDQQELARVAGSTRRAGRRAPASSAGVPRTASGPGASAERTGTTRQRRVEGIGDHGQIGQFGHGQAIVVPGRRVLDSPGPERQTAEE